MVRISFSLRTRSVQINLGAILLQRQALGNLVGELIVIRIVRVIVVSNGAIEVVSNILADMGIGSIVFCATPIARDLLLDGGDFLFRRNIH